MQYQTKHHYNSIILTLVLGLLLMTNSFANNVLKTCDVTLPDTPNYALAFPHGYCQLHANVFSPVYPVSAEVLYQNSHKLIQALPRSKDIKLDPKQQRLYFTQNSRLFHFPDKIEIRIITTGMDESSLLIYSHSVYGYSDFGANKRRVLTILKLLKAQLAKHSGQKNDNASDK